MGKHSTSKLYNTILVSCGTCVRCLVFIWGQSAYACVTPWFSGNLLKPADAQTRAVTQLESLKEVWLTSAHNRGLAGMLLGMHPASGYSHPDSHQRFMYRRGYRCSRGCQVSAVGWYKLMSQHACKRCEMSCLLLTGWSLLVWPSPNPPPISRYTLLYICVCVSDVESVSMPAQGPHCWIKLRFSRWRRTSKFESNLLSEWNQSCSSELFCTWPCKTCSDKPQSCQKSSKLQCFWRMEIIICTFCRYTAQGLRNVMIQSAQS